MTNATMSPENATINNESSTVDTGVLDKLKELTPSEKMGLELNLSMGYSNAVGQFVWNEKNDIVFKKDVTDKMMAHDTACMLEISNEYNGIISGYFKLLPSIARAYHSRVYERIEDCPSMGKLLQLVTGCAQSTASELTKVASVMYNGNGILESGYEIFGYHDLIELSKLDIDLRNCVRDLAKDLMEKKNGKAATRKELRELVSKACETYPELAPKKWREAYELRKKQEEAQKLLEEQKAEEQTAEEQTAEEQTAEEQTTEEQTEEEQTAEEQTAEEQTAEEQTAEEQTESSTVDEDEWQDATIDLKTVISRLSVFTLELDAPNPKAFSRLKNADKPVAYQNLYDHMVSNAKMIRELVQEWSGVLLMEESRLNNGNAN